MTRWTNTRVAMACWCLTLTLCFSSFSGLKTQAGDTRVLPVGQRPNDVRLGSLKDLNGYFPFHVPHSREAWEARAAELRQRILVATGLWPLPERTPLNAVIFDKTKRPGFTVEKVYFESLPNHFVTGLLFRPDDGQTGRRPAVLSPHGHGGRLQDYGADKIRQLIADGAERFEASGRYPKLARCAHLARMGCVTFIYDMVGYADSVQIDRGVAHGLREARPAMESSDRWGLFSPQAELRLQHVMGLQTWNSLRSLDFLESLPDVDPQRIGMTGGSGGGTQAILLGAIDKRPIVSFPNGMVSTSMQGGCPCENAPLLRIGTGNVELAALFAPRPQAMTAADDWTREMMTKGYPELQQLYALYDAQDDVYCRPLLHFPHNFNYVTRATVYAWMNKHLKLGLQDPVLEEDFEPLTDQEQRVWGGHHPRPPGGEAYEFSLTRYLTETSVAQINALTPRDRDSWKSYQQVVGQAWRILIGRKLPAASDIQRTNVTKEPRDGYLYFEDMIRLLPAGEELPVISVFPTSTTWNEDVAIWVNGKGKRSLLNDGGELRHHTRLLIDRGFAVMSADLFLQGEFGEAPVSEQPLVKNPRPIAAYTFGYNHSLFAKRTHDVLTLIAMARNYEHKPPKRIHLIGLHGAGPIAAAASMVAGSQVDKTLIDTQGFRFRGIESFRDTNFLPGSVKYGDVPSILALIAPRPLTVLGEGQTAPEITAAAYAASGAPGQLHVVDEPHPPSLVDWLAK